MQILEDKLICSICIHNDPEEMGCKAYPDGIPLEYILKKGHKKIHKNQVGNYVFQKSSMDKKI